MNQTFTMNSGDVAAELEVNGKYSEAEVGAGYVAQERLRAVPTLETDTMNRLAWIDAIIELSKREEGVTVHVKARKVKAHYGNVIVQPIDLRVLFGCCVDVFSILNNGDGTLTLTHNGQKWLDRYFEPTYNLTRDDKAKPRWKANARD